MEQSSRHDAWAAGDSYDAYMGRWSRRIAPRFLAWLSAPKGLDWLDIGCGTGVLSAAIVADAAPRSVLSIDPSEGFMGKARQNVPDPRVTFEVGSAEALPAEKSSKDIVVSGLVLNFVPDREKALAEMRRVGRPGATIAFSVWDYAGRGVGFMRAFWEVASRLDPAAADLTEDRRFPFCNARDLTGLAEQAGLGAVVCAPIEAPTVFADFDDFWRPFRLGASPAPGYCASLAADARERLRVALSEALPREADGSIALTTRAWAIRSSNG